MGFFLKSPILYSHLFPREVVVGAVVAGLEVPGHGLKVGQNGVGVPKDR